MLAQNRTPARTVDLDVLSEDNAETYWTRDERFDLAVSLNRGQPALAALCRVLQRWIAHFLAVDVTIAPEREIVDARWVWHVGLDAEASALLNDLYNGVDVADDRRERLLCLFELCVSPIRRRCVRRSPGGRYTWRWRWIAKTACDSSHRTCC